MISPPFQIWQPEESWQVVIVQRRGFPPSRPCALGIAGDGRQDDDIAAGPGAHRARGTDDRPLAGPVGLRSRWGCALALAVQGARSPAIERRIGSSAPACPSPRRFGGGNPQKLRAGQRPVCLSWPRTTSRIFSTRSPRPSVGGSPPGGRVFFLACPGPHLGDLHQIRRRGSLQLVPAIKGHRHLQAAEPSERFIRVIGLAEDLLGCPYSDAVVHRLTKLPSAHRPM